MSKDILPEIEGHSQNSISTSRENFVATVAHDFKTPIYAEINALKLLLNNSFGNLCNEQKEIVEDILNSTRYLKDLVENVLCQSKFEFSEISLFKRKCRFKDIVKSCIESAEYILKPKNQ